jgi:hypothetical protein
MYSSGFSDNLLIEWSLQFFMEKGSATNDQLQKIEGIDEN